MTYATQADLVDRFGEAELAQLTDRDTGAVIDAAVVARALADADAEIDGYLAARYALPLPTTPALLTRLASDIARYRLYDERTTEAVRQRYQDATRMLDRIAAGTVALGSSAPEATDGAAVAVTSRAPDRLFGPDVLGSY